MVIAFEVACTPPPFTAEQAAADGVLIDEAGKAGSADARGKAAQSRLERASRPSQPRREVLGSGLVLAERVGDIAGMGSRGTRV